SQLAPMDKQKCPECKATKYTNPSLKMMVNACGHALCENCVDILFSRGSGACPQCKTPLRRGQFRFQMFEDSQVEKELDIRKRLMKDLNLSEDNFSSLAEYNNYLEFVESAVFNLANEIDVEATKRSVEEFKKAHADAIKSNRLRRRPELAALDNVIESEASGSGRSNGVETAAAAAAPGATASDAAAAGAAAAVSSAASVSTASSTASAGVASTASMAGQNSRPPASSLDPDTLAELVKPHRLALNGPSLDSAAADAAVSVLADRLPADYPAGGYTAQLGLHRLLADAYCDLYYRL
ncbi:hypothetical protein BOX15_Mlig008523g3, partial [Macrostomum lignano]